MEKIVNKKILNVLLRLISAGSRFVLIFCLAKYSSASDVAYFGVFSSIVAYGILFVGLDFYTYTTREITGSDVNVKGKMIINQIYLVLILYLVFLYPLTLYFSGLGLPNSLDLMFVFLLVVEHAGQECTRLLLALSKQIEASFVIFFRQGLWALIGAILLIFYEESILELLIRIWFVSSFVGVLIGMNAIKKLTLGGWFFDFDTSWVLNGIKTSLYFLVATLALRGVFTFDRVIILDLSGEEVAAAYIFFMTVSNAVMIFLDSSTFSFFYPQLLNMNIVANKSKFELVLKKTILETVIILMIFCFLSYLGMGYLLSFFNEAIYYNNIDIFPVVLISICFYSLSMIPHFALYAINLDRVIVKAHIISFGVFFILIFMMRPFVTNLLVPLSLSLSMGVLFCIKSYYFLRYKNQINFIG